MIISILISSHHLLIYAYLYDMYSVYDSVRNVNKVILQFIKIYHIKWTQKRRDFIEHVIYNKNIYRREYEGIVGKVVNW